MRDLEESNTRLNSICLEISLRENKFLKSPRQQRGQKLNILTLGNKDVEKIIRFEYLGSLVTEQNCISEEVIERLGAGM